MEPFTTVTGVAAPEVKRASRFLVHHGPVLARDIPAYLAAGLEATPAMRRHLAKVLLARCVSSLLDRPDLRAGASA